MRARIHNRAHFKVNETFRGHEHWTSAIFLDFLTPSPLSLSHPCNLSVLPSAFGGPPPPPNTDIICTCPLNQRCGGHLLSVFDSWPPRQLIIRKLGLNSHIFPAERTRMSRCSLSLSLSTHGWSGGQTITHVMQPLLTRARAGVANATTK